MTAVLPLPPFAILVFVALGYRRRFLRVIEQRDAAESKCCKALDDAKQDRELLAYWQSACRSSYGMAITREQQDAMWERIRAKIEPPPMDLLIGTTACPLVLTRVLDSSLNDTARYSTLDSFCPTVIP